MKTHNAISPGDWHRFQYEGNAVSGVVYRIEGDGYTMFLPVRWSSDVRDRRQTSGRGRKI